MTATTTEVTREQQDAAAYAASKAHDGNATKAAAEVGMARTTFRAAVKRHETRLAQDTEAEGTPAQDSDPFDGIPNADDADNAPLLPPAEPETAEVPAPAAVEAHDYRDDGTDPGNCSVCHFFHTDMRGPNGERIATMAEDTPAEPASQETPRGKGTYRPKPAVNKCACRCGELTARTFARGHDSRYAKQLRAAYAAGEMTAEQVLATAKGVSDRFHGKLAKSLNRASESAALSDGPCACGCGQITLRTFARGHDSKYATMLVAAYTSGEMTRNGALSAAEVISDRFRGKVARGMDKYDAKQATKEAAKADKAARQ